MHIQDTIPIAIFFFYAPDQIVNLQITFAFFSAESDGLGFTAFLLTALSVILIVVTVPFSLCLVIKVVAGTFVRAFKSYSLEYTPCAVKKNHLELAMSEPVNPCFLQ